MSPNRPIVLGLTGHGTLEGFEGRRGSGIGFLKIRDDETGRVLRIPAENAPTTRALDAAFGNVIGPGHTASSKSFLGRRIAYELDDLGMLASFTPEEEVVEA